MTRTELAGRQLNSTGTLRMLDATFGYPNTLGYDMFYDAYRRIGVARRIISAYVDFTWRKPPKITDNKALAAAFVDLNINETLKRADTLACIGRYSVLVISDGDVPMITAYSEKQAQVETWDTEPTSSRYGLPETYRITVRGEGTDIVGHTIHHSRVIHIADDLIDNAIYGTPKLEAVYNYIHDLYKVVGSSAEMYWLGAYQGLVFNIDREKELLLTDEAIADMDRSIEEYYSKLRRNLKLYGAEVHSLPSVTPNPSGIVDVLVQLISAGRGIPTRIFWGSEQGQLASSTDRDMWLSKIAGRQETFAGAVVLKPLIDRLVDFGYLPGGDYTIAWPTLIERDAGEVVADGAKVIQAVRDYVGADGNIGSMLNPDEVRKILGLEA